MHGRQLRLTLLGCALAGLVAASPASAATTLDTAAADTYEIQLPAGTGAVAVRSTFVQSISQFVWEVSATVDGVAGAEKWQFRNKVAVTVVAPADATSQAFEIDSVLRGDTVMTSLALAGGAGGDTFAVEATPTGPTMRAEGGAGNDAFTVGQGVGGMVDGPVEIDGGTEAATPENVVAVTAGDRTSRRALPRGDVLTVDRTGVSGGAYTYDEGVLTGADQPLAPTDVETVALRAGLQSDSVQVDDVPADTTLELDTGLDAVGLGDEHSDAVTIADTGPRAIVRVDGSGYPDTLAVTRTGPGSAVEADLEAQDDTATLLDTASATGVRLAGGPDDDTLAIRGLAGNAVARLEGAVGDDALAVGQGTLLPVEGAVAVDGGANGEQTPAEDESTFAFSANGKTYERTFALGDTLTVQDQDAAFRTYELRAGELRHGAAPIHFTRTEVTNVDRAEESTGEVRGLAATDGIVQLFGGSVATATQVDATGDDSALAVYMDGGEDDATISSTGARSLVTYVTRDRGGTDAVSVERTGEDAAFLAALGTGSTGGPNDLAVDVRVAGIGGVTKLDATSGTNPGVLRVDCSAGTTVAGNTATNGARAIEFANFTTPPGCLPALPGGGAGGGSGTGGGADGVTTGGGSTPSVLPELGRPLLVPASPGQDTARPTIANARLTRTRFRVGTTATALSAQSTARGTTFQFRVSEAARVSVAVQQHIRGRRSGNRCVAGRARRGRRSCRRTVTLHTLRRTGRAGINTLAYTGRVGRKALKPGAYTAVISAVDAARNRSRPVTLRFTVVRR